MLDTHMHFCTYIFMKHAYARDSSHEGFSLGQSSKEPYIRNCGGTIPTPSNLSQFTDRSRTKLCSSPSVPAEGLISDFVSRWT